ncbi:penicillin-binding protein [Sedimentibacter sp. zth1]|uniref:penicillin-binding transpeptidase domain-containing protein n=1 Tax=Sedimentibacter sp. zth1 TaxID=2816908 RepID=UPI001A91DBD9|nr:penicillin-binding transpeptidase domain-containing protein [Sedimentibacter sp. zth1]QSX06211.1 penicillin-binding protein [Sedimentibacter sp. zth1]
MIVIITILSFKLATLTVVEGEKYREVADVKKIKDIPIKAPRGKIYDRNGVVLADNLTSFTVQIYKNKVRSGNFIDTAFALTKILEENGESLIDEFPILLDTFEFVNEEDGVTQSETESVISIIRDNNLFNEWINAKVDIDNITLSIKEKVSILLNKEMKLLPIKLENDMFLYTLDDEGIKKWLVDNNYSENLTCDELVHDIISRDNRFMLNLLSNSRIRKITYNMLNSKGLIDSIKLVPFSFIYDRKYKTIKSNLIEKYDGITNETTAKEDFIYLTKLEVFDYLFSSAYGEDKQVVPAELLLNKLKETYSDLPVQIKVENGIAEYEYIEDFDKDKYIKDLNLESTVSAYHLIKILSLKENTIVDNVITSIDVAPYAQIELLNREINPNISIASWKYSPIRDKYNWISNNLGKSDKNKSVEEIFKILKKDLKLDEEMSNYDVRNILVVKDRYNKQGYLSYYPIDICYNISEKSVAMISERNYELEGVNIEIEPIRYYPEKSLAAHVLGYLGKISQEYEIEEYIENQGYSLDDIIGKTGIEEKFESYLCGLKGKKTVAVNSTGNTIESVDELAPRPGDDVYLTIDARLQAKAQEALEKGLKTLQVGGTYESEWGKYKFSDAYKNATSASLVALDVKTGEVLALANYPSYDLNMFATGISSEDWNSLQNDSKDPLSPRPLYNTALLTAIQPGSTFKMITALAALEKGVNPNEKIYCAGVMEVGGRNFGCWIYNLRRGAHGNQDIYQAIKNSCNFYFFTTMLGENPATGQKHSIKLDFEDVTNMAVKFGLNDPTGIEIDIPKEYSGGVPNLDSKKSTIRMYLRFFLEDKLKNYVIDDYDMDDDELKNVIEEIVSWINAENVLTRGEVYEKLDKLNINPEKTYGDNIPIVDILKYTYINQAAWNSGDSLNLSIGQGSNAYTPIQMANYVATIANGGYKHNVSVIDKILSYDKSKLTYLGERVSERVELSDYSYLDIVKEGMKLVANDSSVFRSFPVQCAVKTGTAQKDGINPETGEEYDDFAWYVAYGPYEDAQIAVACVIFQGGSGLYPAPIVRDVIGEYLVLNGKLERPTKE